MPDPILPGPLPDEPRHLVRVAAAVAGAPHTVVRRTLAAALAQVDATALEEVLLQSHLFAGFPRALNAFSAWRDLSGAAAPDRDPGTDAARAPEWTARGEVACRTVYGPVYDTLRDSVRALHPALDAWMVTDGYGKVLARPGLPLLQRELCIVAACAATEQRPQLRAHLRGAVNCGATREQLEQTLAALTDLIGREALAAAREELAHLPARALAAAREG